MKKAGRAIAVLLFLAVLASGLTVMHFSYDFKYLDSVYKLKSFYKLPDDSVDILALGSSHTYQGINTATLWDEYGAAAFDLCGPAQPIANTYFYLKEALKTQTPKVALLDMYSMCTGAEYPEEAYGIKNTYGLKFSRDRLDAIDATFEKPKQYYFPLLQYHSRYGDLNEEDFFPYHANKNMYADYKGFYCYFRTEDLSSYGDVSDTSFFTPLSEKNREYLMKIIGLAKQNDLPLVLLGLPFGAERYHESVYRTCKLIADANGVPFYDFLSDYREECGIDYTTDFSEKQHLNYSGSVKITRWLYDNVLSDYDIPDRRGDEKYASWERDAYVFARQLRNYYLSKTADIRDYAVDLAADKGYTVIVTSQAIGTVDVAKALDFGLFDFLDELGIGDGSGKYRDGAWIIRGGLVEHSYDMDELGFAGTISLSRFHDAALYRIQLDTEEWEPEEFVNSILVDDKDYTADRSEGLNIVVYDYFTDSVIDSACFRYKDCRFIHYDLPE